MHPMDQNASIPLAYESYLAQTATVASHTIGTSGKGLAQARSSVPSVGNLAYKPGWLLVCVQAVGKGTNSGGTLTPTIGYKTTDGTTATTVANASDTKSVAGNGTVQSWMIPIYIDNSATSITATYTKTAGTWDSVDIRCTIIDLNCQDRSAR